MESRRERDTFFRASLTTLAARVHDYDAPVPCKSLARGNSVDSDTRSARAIHPPFLLRGSYAAVGARARAAPRDHTAGTPLIPGRRQRRRETALTPLRSSSSFI